MDKHDVFVLDFVNDTGTIERSFEDYYRTTVLSDEADANKLHDLKAELNAHQVYTEEEVDRFVALFLDGAGRDQLDPILDACQAVYVSDLDEDAQIDFKGKAKAFTRTYNFLASILPYTNAEWEKLSIFLNFLVSKLPAPDEPDLSKGLLEAIDMDSYRIEKREAMRIQLADTDAEIEPVPSAAGGGAREPELEPLSEILKTFNELFGNIEWTDKDRIERLVFEDIPAQVSADAAYQNARKNPDKQNARIEHDKALGRVMNNVLKDDSELFKQFQDNDDFRRWITETIFRMTYEEGAVALRLFEREPFERIPESAVRPFENAIPLLSLKAAAGYFRDEEAVEPEAWVRPEGVAPKKELFVAQVVGESMNRRIPNGAYCLFRTPVEGSRQGRVVLVEHRDIVDPELAGPFTVKLWESDKEPAEGDSWRHEEIRLKPDSNDPTFEPIILRDVREGELQVVAELVQALAGPADR